MPDEENKPQAPDGDRAAGSGLYTKSSRSSRSRLLDQPSGKKLISVQIGKPQRSRRKSRSNPFQQIFKANLKRLGMVAGLMLLLLIAAIQLVNLVANRPSAKAEGRRPDSAAPVAGSPAEGATTMRGRTGDTNAETFRPTISADQYKKAVYLQNKGKAYENGGNYELAVQNYREALDVLPNMPAVWAQLGRVYLKQKDFWHAQVALEKAVESTPTADLFNDLGVSYLWQEGKLERALTMFQTATEVDPNYAPTYFNKALALLAKNESQRAREALEQYLRMKAEDPRGLRELACLKARDGARDEALRDLERAIAQAPDWPLLYFDAAAINALLGHCDTAIRYLEKAVPLSGPAPVFKIWQEPAFRECRISEMGKVFEKDVADAARDALKQGEKAPAPTTSEPILSTP